MQATSDVNRGHNCCSLGADNEDTRPGAKQITTLKCLEKGRTLHYTSISHGRHLCSIAMT